MQIDLEALRKHYQSLTDDAILAIDPDELTDEALAVLNQEMDARGLSEPEDDTAPGDDDAPLEDEAEPEWKEDAAVVCSFSEARREDLASDLRRARGVLDEAGIPAWVHVVEPASEGRTPEWQVTVPGALLLEATSLLDREIFNEQLENDWRAHFANLTDQELDQIDENLLIAGLIDRAERLRLAFEDEMVKRGLMEPAPPDEDEHGAPEGESSPQ